MVLKSQTNKSFLNSIEKSDKIIEEIEYIRNPNQYPSEDPKSKFIECMACCHSCVLVNDNLVGEPLETEMFKTTEWVVKENISEDNVVNSDISMFVYPRVLAPEIENRENNDSYKLGIIKRFDFSSELQRMSVAVKNFIDGKIILFIKGSPEQIHELLDPKTIPADYFDVLQSYTHFGLRVIALGYRILDLDIESFKENIDRDTIETNITFLGFLVFENKLKEGTAQWIADLKHGMYKWISK